MLSVSVHNINIPEDREFKHLHSVEMEFINSHYTSKQLYPMFGQRVSCGLFGIHDDYIEKYQSLDTRFIKNKASTFFFKAEGNSMNPLIIENDILIVDRSIEKYNKKVVVIALNGELICKRYLMRGNQHFLVSENPLYPEIKLDDSIDHSVFGVVTAIARELI